jgi:hypothetical protein
LFNFSLNVFLYLRLKQPAVVPTLGHEKQSVREAALVAVHELVRHGTRHVADAILSAVAVHGLEHDDPSVRAYSCGTLASVSAALLAAAAAARDAPPPPQLPGAPPPRPAPAMLDVRHVFDLLVRRLRDMSEVVQAGALKALTTVWYAAPDPGQAAIAASKLSLPQQQVLAKHAPKLAAIMYAHQQSVAAGTSNNMRNTASAPSTPALPINAPSPAAPIPQAPPVNAVYADFVANSAAAAAAAMSSGSLGITGTSINTAARPNRFGSQARGEPADINPSHQSMSQPPPTQPAVAQPYSSQAYGYTSSMMESNQPPPRSAGPSIAAAASAMPAHMYPNTPMPNSGNPNAEMMEYGCIPASLIAQLKSVDRNSDYRVRNAAIDEIAIRLAECAVSPQRLTVLVPHLGALVRLLAVLLHDSNMKIVQTALTIVLDLADKLPAEFRPHISLILSRLIEKFGDKVLALRLAALQVLYKLIATHPLDHICYQLMSCLKYPSALVREHAVIVLTYVLLSAADSRLPIARLDTRQMAAELVGALSDQKPRVVSVVIELLAVLADPRWLGTSPLLTSVHDRLEPAQRLMLQERFAQPSKALLAYPASAGGGPAAAQSSLVMRNSDLLIVYPNLPHLSAWQQPQSAQLQVLQQLLIQQKQAQSAPVPSTPPVRSTPVPEPSFSVVPQLPVHSAPEVHPQEAVENTGPLPSRRHSQTQPAPAVVAMPSTPSRQSSNLRRLPSNNDRFVLLAFCFLIRLLRCSNLSFCSVRTASRHQCDLRPPRRPFPRPP